MAKYYLYRNLHTGTFSLKFKGKVILHPSIILMNDVEFRVSEKGRQRVLKEKQKNVHAYLVSKNKPVYSFDLNFDDYTEVYYNPYIYNGFVLKESGVPVLFTKRAIGINNKIYILKE